MPPSVPRALFPGSSRLRFRALFFLALGVWPAPWLALRAAPTTAPEFCAPTIPADVAAAALAAEPESTRKMAALLAKITTEGNPLDNPYRSTEIAQILG